ncbi:MAG: AbrB/MazE/SpoVT family DNA-binding domain-containing protein [Zoogloeaceae bacterium]|jgi:bifunctional DNA-binding transcriptional regulator/antitoxin component of YhaV-PrlF toxin-antitoxin module|nr:AbrB/MazE/SpoVT family DNA-binding domain-containing protein [Zoogloeaceae bacterium]
MTTLTVTPTGQLPFESEMLQYLGVKPGENIEIEKLPDARIILKAAKSRSFRDLQGCLKGKTNGQVLSIEEINEAIEESAIAAMERT